MSLAEHSIDESGLFLRMKGAMTTSDWRLSVYYQETEALPDNWNKISLAIRMRDKYICFRCDKKFKKSDLSVHHIVPRKEGGTEDGSNLVTLCHPCHDHVEINQLKSKTDIIASFDEPLLLAKKKPTKTVIHKDESFTRPTWHSVVYGGQKS